MITPAGTPGGLSWPSIIKKVTDIFTGNPRKKTGNRINKSKKVIEKEFQSHNPQTKTLRG